MKKELFRKKSMDKISSPDQLNDYIHVSNPSAWIIIVAVIVVLIGACVWGIFGKLETKVPVAAASDGKSITCFVPEKSADAVKVGMPIVIDNKEYAISSISDDPIAMTADYDEYILHVGNLKVGQWVYKANSNSDIDEGVYSAYIVTEKISPISFVFN